MQRSFFLYTRSNDVEASRRFYTDLLGLDQIWHEDGDVAYSIADAVQLVVSHDPDAVQLVVSHDPDAPPTRHWSGQPGWVHGLPVDPPPPLSDASWGIALPPDRFRAAVARLQDAGVEALRPEPFWVGYWSYVVRDPMGQTVELSDPSSPPPS